MKTAQNIVDLMAEEMPFKLNPDIVPSIIEAMKLYANQKIDESINVIDSFNEVGDGEIVQSILSLKDQI